MLPLFFLLAAAIVEEGDGEWCRSHRKVCAQDNGHKKEYHEDRMPSDPHGQRTTPVFLVVLLRRMTLRPRLLILPRGFLRSRCRRHAFSSVTL